MRGKYYQTQTVVRGERDGGESGREGGVEGVHRCRLPFRRNRLSLPRAHGHRDEKEQHSSCGSEHRHPTADQNDKSDMSVNKIGLFCQSSRDDVIPDTPEWNHDVDTFVERVEGSDRVWRGPGGEDDVHGARDSVPAHGDEDSGQSRGRGGGAAAWGRV
jgi:hypothetical protein